jgi:arylsulfatase A-like enzyme
MPRSGIPAAALAVSWLAGRTVLGAAAPAAAAPSKPHIVFFLADDLGYNNIGYHNHVTLSPHIDEFFGTGLQLNHSFSHKWCAPTRGALMSGRLPFKTGLEHGSLGAYSAPEYALALSANFTLLPETLKKAGYSTHSTLPPCPQPTAVHLHHGFSTEPLHWRARV